MKKTVPLVLWTLVILGALTVFFVRNQAKPVNSGGAVDAETATDSNLSTTEDGRTFASVPWKHLPDVDRFKLTDQTGAEFDSADLTGRPYVVSFFFADCPTFCRSLNNELHRVNQALKGTDIQFLTITVDPDVDTPEVLGKYAEGYDATPDRWAFLTGQMYQLKEVGEHMFNVVVDRDTHTDNILLVDKWGRYRDRFKWDQPHDMKRFIQVAQEVAAETEPPLDAVVETRNVMAGRPPVNLKKLPWIRDFHLVDSSGEPFFSRDLTGEVWVASFFFTSCPGICKQQNQHLRDLLVRLGDRAPRFVSMSTQAATDTPERLREYVEELGASDLPWTFLTGDPHLIERVGSEYFHAASGTEHHSSLLYVVDRWGDVRGKFDWQSPEQEVEMLKLVEQLKTEDRPPRPVDQARRLPPEEGAAASEEEGDGAGPE